MYVVHDPRVTIGPGSYDWWVDGTLCKEVVRVVTDYGWGEERSERGNRYKIKLVTGSVSSLASGNHPTGQPLVSHGTALRRDFVYRGWSTRVDLRE